MNFVLLEKLINEKIKEQNIEKDTVRNLTDKVEKIVRDILREHLKNNYSLLYVNTEKGNIIIRKSCSYNRYAYIKISIKKKLEGRTYKMYYGSITEYSIKEVTIDDYDEYDSIESFIEYNNMLEAEKVNSEKRKLARFESSLQDTNIDFKVFFELMENYKSLSYNDKEALAKKYAGKNYYMFY